MNQLALAVADPSVMPQIVAALAGLGGVIVGSLISWRVQARLLGRRILADEALAERKYAFDTDLAERRFKYDRDLHDHKRRLEIAEGALVAFYEARRTLQWVRSRGSVAGEGSSRTPADGESITQQEMRNTYFIPIERLSREKDVFAKLESLRYVFAANFSEESSEPFKAILDVHNQIASAASVLIQITDGYREESKAFRGGEEPLRNILGWGPASRPDEIDQKVDKAFQDIQTLSGPVLKAEPF